MPAFRFNHMQLTLPCGTIHTHRAAIEAFYSEVFDFRIEAFPGMTEENMVLVSDEADSQFIFLSEHDRPMQAPGPDHLGLIYESREEIDELLEKCKVWQKNDARVELDILDDLVLEETVTHAFYVRFMLPIWFDVQHIEYKAGCEPAQQWRFINR